MASSVLANAAERPKSTYGKVVLSLENCILPPDKLFPTPSFLDGLDRESETDLRILGCELIQTSGILLRLPQVAMATGQILFQRFYYSKSFVRQSMEFVAMACVTLASKIEEAPRRIRDVINVFHHIKQVRSGKTIQPLILDQNYINYKNQVIKAERRVLKELGFCVHVKHPHKIIVTLLEILKVKNHDLLQTAWNYMNDSLRSEVFLRYHPETIACACIYLSAKLLQIPLPKKPAWYQVFGVVEDEIHSICHIILSLYTRKKPDGEKLEKMVEQLRKAHEEAKLKAKALSSMGSDSTKNHSFSPVTVSPKSIKLPAVEVKKEKEIENGDVLKPSRENNHRKKTYSPVGDVSPYAKKRSRSSSSDSASSQSPRGQRHKHKSLPRSYKKTRRSRSRSKTREGKKSKHHSSHKKKVNRSYSRSPHKRSSKKDRNGDRSPYRSTNRSHHSGHEKHRKDR